METGNFADLFAFLVLMSGRNDTPSIRDGAGSPAMSRTVGATSSSRTGVLTACRFGTLGPRTNNGTRRSVSYG